MNLHEIELLVNRNDKDIDEESECSSRDDEFQVHPQHLIMPSIDNHRDSDYRQNVQQMHEIDAWHDVTNVNNSSDPMFTAAQ